MLRKDCTFIHSSDAEIIGYALDTLYNIICNDLEEEEQGRRLISPLNHWLNWVNAPVERNKNHVLSFCYRNYFNPCLC